MTGPKIVEATMTPLTAEEEALQEPEVYLIPVQFDKITTLEHVILLLKAAQISISSDNEFLDEIQASGMLDE